ncbi:MAG: dihydrodipicolinate synthase family protein, partial [Flavobacteriaceae bacterium]|nr:dihydrodipicolinate synthase family protein [Flavobacteriaceae bacterium]
VISVIAQAFPKIFSDSIKLALDKKKSINKLNKIISLIFEENNPAGIKYVLSKKHLCKNILRLPIVSVTESLKLKIDLELDNI